MEDTVAFGTWLALMLRIASIGVLVVILVALVFLLVRYLHDPTVALADLIKSLHSSAYWLVIIGLLAINVALVVALLRCLNQLPQNPVCC